MSSLSSPEVSLEALQLIGRVYYQGTNANHDPFDAVFTVLLLESKHARLLAAHGTINFRAYKEIARQLYETYGVETCEVERHGKPEIWNIKKFLDRLKLK